MIHPINNNSQTHNNVQPATNNTINSSSSLVIQEHVSLRDKNWFNTGGNARYFCEPTTEQEFKDALVYADMHKLPLFILGLGANILVSDSGFDGLIIRPRLTTITIIKDNVKNNDNQALVQAGAGVTIEELINHCLDNHILGLEEFSGIPGTVGGSVYINLHYYEFLLSQFIVEAVIIHRQTKVIETVPVSWFAFGYNKSRLQEHTYFILSTTFRLRTCNELDAAYARGRSVEIIRHRVNRYPSKNTCGSFFRNFHDHEVSLEINNKKMIYIAYYLDKIGVKGALQVGGALVSYQHANMLVNTGNATSQDIVNLARAMQEKVFQQFGIIPNAECLFIGFDQHPLLQAK